MNKSPKVPKARLRLALAKGSEIARRQKDLETCVGEAEQVALAAALADDYAALLTEYPDVFPTPPLRMEEVRAHARELRESQAALEAAEEANKEATRELRLALNGLTLAPAKTEKPS